MSEFLNIMTVPVILCPGFKTFWWIVHYRSHESFSLESLSEDKCILKSSKGNDRLTKGMVYQIRSPKDQALIYALWNGEKFEDLKDEDLKGRKIFFSLKCLSVFSLNKMSKTWKWHTHQIFVSRK